MQAVGSGLSIAHPSLTGFDTDLPDDVCNVEVGFLIFKLSVVSSA